MQGDGNQAGGSGDDKVFGEGPGWVAHDAAQGALAFGPLGLVGGGLLGWLITKLVKKRLQSR